MTPMTSARDIDKFHADQRALRDGMGFSTAVAEALTALETAMFHWHRQVMKGELAGRITSELGLGLEPAQFRALFAVFRLSGGMALTPARPASIGALAEELEIDPSRASRLAADLVEKGYLRREADQSDGRKSVLAVTDMALDAFRAFRLRKWAIMNEVFSDWADEDVVQMATLFARYVSDVQAVGNGQD